MFSCISYTSYISCKGKWLTYLLFACMALSYFFMGLKYRKIDSGRVRITLAEMLIAALVFVPFHLFMRDVLFFGRSREWLLRDEADWMYVLFYWYGIWFIRFVVFLKFMLQKTKAELRKKLNKYY